MKAFTRIGKLVDKNRSIGTTKSKNDKIKSKKLGQSGNTTNN
jgi:hypothetical protein